MQHWTQRTSIISTYKQVITPLRSCSKMITTIPLEKETRDRIKSLGRKGETYDQILKRLISLAEYEEFMERQYERLRDKESFVPLDEI